MTVQELVSYFKTISANRIRLSDVPEQYEEAVSVYQLNYDSGLLPFQAHQRALKAAARATCEMAETTPCGNCPRCDGRGFIKAFSHVHGGRCLKCDGTGNV